MFGGLKLGSVADAMIEAPLWSRKSLQNETKKVLLTGESAY